MKILRRFLPCLLLFVLPAALVAAEAGRYLRAADYDVATIIPAAPAVDSLATMADIETVYQVQQRRTPEQAAVAAYFAVDDIFQYDAVLGSWFSARNLPETAAFFAQVEADRFAISSQGKKLWSRPRPPLLDARIRPCIELPVSGSYPSGHATQAYLWSGLLSEIFPEKRPALNERAQLVAWSRIVAGVHYPTDIAAGRILGERLAHDFLRQPEVQAALARIRAEVAPFLQPEPPK
ncbi:MAG TPA: phosphatase PAP2 family protein [Lacunisphaera sp.]|nr:phosphatase PAP2 family protein [Lacunisphaera sp.]